MIKNMDTGSETFSLIIKGRGSRPICAVSEPHRTTITLTSDDDFNYYDIRKVDPNTAVFNVEDYNNYCLGIIIPPYPEAVPFLISLDEVVWYCNNCGNQIDIKFENGTLPQPESCPDCEEDV